MAKKEIKKAEAVNAFTVLKGLKLTNCDKQTQFSVLRTARALRAIASDIDEFAKDASERLKPENLDAVIAKSRKFATLSEEEKSDVNRVINDYNQKVNECVNEELAKSVEVELPEAISEENLLSLSADNPGLDVSQILLIADLWE